MNEAEMPNNDLSAYAIGLHPFSPGVYLEFDDGTLNHYQIAFPYLRSKGLAGNFNITRDWIIQGHTGSPGNYPTMTEANMQEMDAGGMYIGNHTRDHTSLPTLNLAQQEAELADCKNYLDGLGLTKGSKYLAYPGGAYNNDTLTAMDNTGMLTGRVAGGDANKIYLTSIKALTQHALTIGRGADTLASVQNLVRTSVSRGLWMGLLFHLIVTTPSYPDAYAILDTNFMALIDWLIAQQIPIYTIEDIHKVWTGIY
jgi:peptidoglycan/xylan/chitin deacetylase (PgdA/CDA1 family)